MLRRLAFEYDRCAYEYQVNLTCNVCLQYESKCPCAHTIKYSENAANGANEVAIQASCTAREEITPGTPLLYLLDHHYEDARQNHIQ